MIVSTSRAVLISSFQGFSSHGRYRFPFSSRSNRLYDHVSCHHIIGNAFLSLVVHVVSFHFKQLRGSGFVPLCELDFVCETCARVPRLHAPAHSPVCSFSHFPPHISTSVEFTLTWHSLTKYRIASGMPIADAIDNGVYPFQSASSKLALGC